MNKPQNTKRIFVRDLNVNDRFTLDGSETVYVVDRRSTQGNMTRVDYHIGKPTALNSFSFAKVNLSSATLIVD